MEEENKFSTMKNIGFTASKVTPIPGLDSLGYGYNVFSLYASPKSVTFPLFNLGDAQTILVLGKTYLIPKTVTYQEILNGHYESYNSVSINDYLNQLNTTTQLSGQYNFYSGTLKTDFQMSELRHRKNEYTKIQDIIEKWKLTLPFEAKDLIQLLRPEVHADINNKNLSGSDLFDKYGTHFLREIIVGAKCEYIASTDQINIKNKTNIKLITEAAYKDFTNQVQAELSTEIKNEINDFKRYSTITVNTLGGKPEYSNEIGLQGNYVKWIESINDYPVFCNFTPNSLLPIWRLCENDERQNQLISDYLEYAKNKSNPFSQYCITNVKVVKDMNPPAEYELIDKDLNAGTGGEYIYLCYKQGLDDKTSDLDSPITDLDIVVGSSEKDAKSKLKPGFILDPQDLNEGAGGKYVYLCYSKNKANDPVRSIQIIQGSSAQIPPPEDYIKIPVDLNAGSGGKYIYLFYSRNH